MQYAKCAYCETALQRGEKALIQWDLEHFRPKANVREWSYQKSFTGNAMRGGYYRLAYHLGNYVASCKICNTCYKLDYFPIQNARVLQGGTPADHDPEDAFLIYPLGDRADDPRKCIKFDGIEAVPLNGSVRGQLIIDFFDLNREDLQTGRAQVLVHQFRSAYKGYVNGDTDCTRTLCWLLSERGPHSSCTNYFLELCLADHASAIQRLRELEYWLTEQENAALQLKRSARKTRRFYSRFQNT